MDAASAASSSNSARRPGIITRLFYEQFCRVDPDDRARAGRSRSLSGGFSRLVVPLAARNQRLAAHVDGDAAQEPDAVLRDHLARWVAGGLSGAVLHRPGQRALGREAF